MPESLLPASWPWWQTALVAVALTLIINWIGDALFPGIRGAGLRFGEGLRRYLARRRARNAELDQLALSYPAAFLALGMWDVLVAICCGLIMVSTVVLVTAGPPFIERVQQIGLAPSVLIKVSAIMMMLKILEAGLTLHRVAKVAIHMPESGTDSPKNLPKAAGDTADTPAK